MMTSKDLEYEYPGSQVKKNSFKEKEVITVSNISDGSSVAAES